MATAYLSRALGLSAIVVSATVNMGTNSAAKDLEALTRLLIPAFLAQNFTLLCAEEDPSFLPELDKAIPTANVFAAHVRKEVTFHLSKEDASMILIRAAHTARYISQKELNVLKGEQVDITREGFKRWCDQSAKPFIMSLIYSHVKKHAEFESRVTDAKR